MNEKYPFALPEGSVLAGQYIIQKVLGQGGFGITYMALDHKSGQKVAVKEFFPDTLASRTGSTVNSYPGERTDSFQYGKSCFLQEAETLAAFIGNENIVKIYSYFEENGTAYFVMDFVEGISFDEYIRQKGGKVSYDEAESILIHIIDALALVHSRGIIHRDVTPDNIYITNDGTVKLLDFGAARYSLGDKSRSLDVVLKHGFAPKEQYTRHGRQGPFTDVYTVGASFYFAITGKRPPDSIDRLEEDDLIPPSSLGVNISREKEDAILKALSVQPGDRFQTMGEFKSALMAAGSVQQGQEGQPAPQAVGRTAQQPAEQTATGQTVTEQTVKEPGQTATGQAMQQPVSASPHDARQKKTLVIAAVIAAVVLLIGGLSIAALSNQGKDEEKSMSAKKQTESSSDLLASANGSQKESESVQEVSDSQEKPSDQSQESDDASEESDSRPEESEESSSEPFVPSDTPQAADLYEEIRGNTPDNIKNQGTAAMSEDEQYLYYRSHGNLRAMDANKTDTLLCEGVSPICISCIGDYVYYVNEEDGVAYRVSREGGDSEAILGFREHSIATLYVSDSYYFAAVYNDSGTVLIRVDRSQGTVTGQVPISDYRQVTFAEGYVYYVGTAMETAQNGKEIECPCIYRMPTGGDWEEPENWRYYIGDADYTDFALDELCSEGNTIYVINRGKVAQGTKGADSSGWEYLVDAFDMGEGTHIYCKWGLSSEYANYNYEVQSPVVFKGIVYYIEKVQKSDEETDYSIRRLNMDDLSDNIVATSNLYHGGLSIVPTFDTEAREEEAFISEFFYMIGRQTIMALDGRGVQMLDK